jgi:hypothetical protein
MDPAAELAMLRTQLAGWKEEAKNALIGNEHLVWERANDRVGRIAERIQQLEALCQADPTNCVQSS